MALVTNTLAKQLSLSDKDGTIFINPTEQVNIDNQRLKELKKHEVIKNYFKLGYLVEVKAQ
jgi:hypothetical protein